MQKQFNKHFEPKRFMGEDKMQQKYKTFLDQKILLQQHHEKSSMSLI